MLKPIAVRRRERNSVNRERLAVAAKITKAEPQAASHKPAAFRRRENRLPESGNKYHAKII